MSAHLRLQRKSMEQKLQKRWRSLHAQATHQWLRTGCSISAFSWRVWNHTTLLTVWGQSRRGRKLGGISWRIATTFMPVFCPGHAVEHYKTISPYFYASRLPQLTLPRINIWNSELIISLSSFQPLPCFRINKRNMQLGNCPFSKNE
jgi:hypothetical protein